MHRRPIMALVEAESGRRDATAGALSAMGHIVRCFGSASGAGSLDADLAILDMDGGGSCDVARMAVLRDGSAAAILAVTASPDPVDRIAALEAGADDAVVGPLPFQELAAQVAGLLERRGAPARELLRL